MLVGAAAVEPVAALGRADVLVGVCACMPELACAFAGALAGALACALTGAGALGATGAPACERACGFSDDPPFAPVPDVGRASDDV